MGLIDKKLFRDELFRHYELLKVDNYEVWAVVDVDEVLDNIEEVKAIPIEWLEKWWREHFTIDTGYDYFLHYLGDMLEDWEKENGK